MSSDSVNFDQMKHFNFLVGKWAGNGWVQFGNDKFSFEQTESVYYKLDGAILILEGQGKSNGKIVHNAYGVYSYDNSNSSYLFDTFESSGRRTQSKATLEDGVIVWSFRDETKGVSIRFTAHFKNSHTWIEEGERTTDGISWQKFFEMTLQKFDPAK